MSPPPLPTPDHFDAYLHDLLPADEAAAVERHVAASEEWRAALDAARRRRNALVAALPPAEPGIALVRATVDRVAGYDAARWRRKRGVLSLMFAPLAAAAAVLVAFNVYYNGLEASPANLELFGQQKLIAGSPASVRVRVTDGRTHAPLPSTPVEIALRDPGTRQFVSLAKF